MKRVMLDTNVYGLIVIDIERDKVKNSIENKTAAIVYGLQLIRKELRDTPKNIRLKGISLRNDLLRVYDEITKHRLLKLTKNEETLANAYFKVYKEFGGFASQNEIMKDLLIVSCASLHSLDIVVSNDNKTMLSDKAIRSYGIVNDIKQINMPRFLNYEEFKKEIR